MVENLNYMLETAGPFSTAPMSKDEVRGAKAIVAAYRERYGFKAAPMPLLTSPADNGKLRKSLAPGWSLSLAQADSSGDWNVCPHYTKACKAHCVAKSGKGGFPAVTRGRSWKVALLAERPEIFVRLLAHEIRNATKNGPITMRLNAFSDLRWEIIAPDLFEIPNVSFYDYTKWNADVRPQLPNYHLTYSATERTSVDQIRGIISKGHNVAVIISASRFQAKSDMWEGMPAIDGDKSDDRTLDKPGHVVLLTAKGSLRRATDDASRRFRHAV